jgi:hypothetical protein
MALVTNNAKQVERELDRKMRLAVEVIGATCEGYAADACPVDTGLLRNSITHGGAGGTVGKTQYASDDGSVTGEYGNPAIPQDIEGSAQYVVVVGTNVHYAPYVEFGHHQEPGRFVPALGKRLKASYVEGKPFLRPAMEGHIDEYKEIWKDILEG